MMSSKINSFRPQGYGDLKEATAALLNSVGGLRKSEAICRVKKSQLSAYIGHRENSQRYIPVDVALELEKACNHKAVTEHMASEHNSVLINLPENFHSTADWWHLVAEVTSEFGDVAKKASEALADGHLSRQECEQWLKEVDELLSITATMRLALKDHLQQI